MLEDIASEAAVYCLYLYREVEEKDVPSLPKYAQECWKVGRQAEQLIKQEIYKE